MSYEMLRGGVKKHTNDSTVPSTLGRSFHSLQQKTMKKGEEDDIAIATRAVSSLLALVNGLDKNKSNKFNELDVMQNHMSNLITAQNEKKTGTNNKKQDSKTKKTDSGEDSSSSSEYKKKTPEKGSRKRTFDSSSSDSDSD
jgi:hypothetical protein